jgi:hypothetical protein
LLNVYERAVFQRRHISRSAARCSMARIACLRYPKVILIGYPDCLIRLIQPASQVDSTSMQEGLFRQGGTDGSQGYPGFPRCGQRWGGPLSAGDERRAGSRGNPQCCLSAERPRSRFAAQPSAILRSVTGFWFPGMGRARPRGHLLELTIIHSCARLCSVASVGSCSIT